MLPSEPTLPHAAPLGWRAGWADLRFPVTLFLLSRGAVLAITAIVLRLQPVAQPGPGLLQHLCRWDCDWYRSIAQDGYAVPAQTNFFPLFPLLARALHEVTGLRLELALVLLGNLAALLSLAVLYRLFRLLADEAAARAALALFVAFPFAYYQAAGYPESLLVLFSALSLLLALRGCPLSSGLALGVGALARHLALVAWLSLLFRAVRERALRRPRVLLGLLLPFALVGLYLAYLGWRFGDPLLFAHVRKAQWPGAWASVTSWFRREWGPELGLYLVFSLIPGAGAFALLARRRWWVLAPFGIVLMLVLWRVGLLGLGRYSASVWPAFLPLGAWLSRRPGLLLPWVLASALLQGMFLALFTQGYPFT